MPKEHTVFEKWRRGGVTEVLGSRMPRSWVGRSVLYFLLCYPVGLGFMAFAAAAGTSLSAREVALGAVWLALLGVWINHSVAQPVSPTAPPHARNSRAAPVRERSNDFLFGAGMIAFAISVWCDDPLRFSLWLLGLGLLAWGAWLTRSETSTGAIKRRSVALAALVVWLASMLIRAVVR